MLGSKIAFCKPPFSARESAREWGLAIHQSRLFANRHSWLENGTMGFANHQSRLENGLCKPSVSARNCGLQIPVLGSRMGMSKPPVSDHARLETGACKPSVSAKMGGLQIPPFSAREWGFANHHSRVENVGLSSFSGILGSRMGVGKPSVSDMLGSNMGFGKQQSRHRGSQSRTRSLNPYP